MSTRCKYFKEVNGKIDEKVLENGSAFAQNALCGLTMVSEKLGEIQMKGRAGIPFVKRIWRRSGTYFTKTHFRVVWIKMQGRE